MVYEGCTLVVWNLPSDPDQLIENARTVGATGVDVKMDDGDSIWTERRYVSLDYVSRLRAAGFRVYGWGYKYWDGKPAEQHPGGGGIVELEAAASVGSIDRQRPDAYSADPETEADAAPPSRVADYFDRVRTGQTATVSGDVTLRGYKCPPLGLFAWTTRQFHGEWELVALDKIDIIRPMCYGEDNPLASFYESWGPILEGKAVAPVFSITDANSDAYLAEQVRQAKERGCIGYGIWERSAVSARPGACQAMMRAWRDVPQPTVPPSSDATLDELRATIYQAAGSLYNSGHQAEGTAIQEIIRLAKGEV